MAAVVDFIAEDKYERYNEILGIMEEAYKNRPKVKTSRGPMTLEQKIKAAEKRKAKADELLAKLMADEGLVDEGLIDTAKA